MTAQCNIAVDLYENKATEAYASMPERLYVIYEGRIVYEGKVTPYYYNLDEMVSTMKKYIKK